MEFLVVLFLFIFPLAAIVMSGYCLFYILGLKKAASKLATVRRRSGKEGSDE